MTGAELRARRLALGMTQQEMHEAMMQVLKAPRIEPHSARSMVWRWERDGAPVWAELVVGIIEEGR